MNAMTFMTMLWINGFIKMAVRKLKQEGRQSFLFCIMYKNSFGKGGVTNSLELFMLNRTGKEVG